MERRKFLIGAGSLAAGSAAAMGTGAFSSVTANRSVAVDIAGDSNAFLSIKSSGTENGDAYTEETQGTFEFTLGEEAETYGGDGFNKNATTIIRDVFEIHNRGTQPVQVWFEGVQEEWSLGSDDTPQTESGTDSNIDTSDSNDTSLDLAVLTQGGNPSPANNWNVDPRLVIPEGKAMKEGYIIIRSSNIADSFSGSVTLKAKAEEEYNY